jgi:hypothetical protein
MRACGDRYTCVLTGAFADTYSPARLVVLRYYGDQSKNARTRRRFHLKWALGVELSE